MRLVFASLVAVAAFAACGPSDRGGSGGDDTDAAPSCQGLECRVVDCAARGLPPTTISGKVFAPNGTLALFGVNVYIPVDNPGPLEAGVTCSRCTDTLQGGSVRYVQSGDDGTFILDNAPSGLNIPIVLQVGKWRRQIVVPNVLECADNPLTAGETSLPRSKLQGDLPKIAIATGNCDALECLVRKIGVADSEFTGESGTGSVNLFSSNGATSFSAGGTFASAHTLWSDINKLKKYDAALFSCECSQLEAEKTQAEMNAIKEYADAGGRLFLSHYHDIWMDGPTGGAAAGEPTPSPDWTRIASCPSETTPGSTAVIDQMSNPKGASFAKWMVNVGGSTSLGNLPVQDARQMCDSVDKTIAEQWVYASGTNKPQTIQFTTPQNVAAEQRCGKVVFSDMHVASGSTSSPSETFPNGCSTDPLSPQEKALAFMLFDIASCVGPVL